MSSVLESIALPALIEERRGDIEAQWQMRVKQDAQFSDLVAGPTNLVAQLAETVRVPQAAERGPEPKWNEAVIDAFTGQKTIGVVGCQLKYLVAAIEDVLVAAVPADELPESIWRLHRAIYFALESASRAAASEIAASALRSAVTGLRNRAGFDFDVGRIGLKATTIYVVYIDMDGLKAINDARGHTAGDAALKDLGRSLAQAMGEADKAYHLSGDEFAVISEGADSAYVDDLMARIASSTSLKFSYGAASLPADGHTITEVIRLADERMQNHKRERKRRGEAPERPS